MVKLQLNADANAGTNTGINGNPNNIPKAYSNANLNASPKASTKKTIFNTYATANSNNAVFRNRLKEQDRNISLKYEYDRC